MTFGTLEQGIADLQRQLRFTCQAEENSFYLPLLGKRFASSEAASEDLATSVSDFIADTNLKRVCALLGDGGSGKSSFLKQFTLKLLNEYTTEKLIPLFISLPLLTDPLHAAIEEMLRKIGFNEAQIAELKVNYSFVFILDGYDEIHQLQNLYVSNRLSEWNAKTIISCRSQYLYNKEQPNLYFMPLENERAQPHLLQTLYVSPFIQDQIKQYLEFYHNGSSNIPSYEEMTVIPGLQDHITTPFLLKLAVEALPEILARYATSSSSQPERQQLTQTDLYKSFIRRWFERQEKKLIDSGHITTDMPDQKPIFWRYCQSLALEMHQHNLSWLDADDERFAVYFENDAETEMLRSTCPIKKTEDKIGFWHASLGMHFVAQTIYQESLSEENSIIQWQQDVAIENNVQERPQGTIHLRLITDDPAALRDLADEVTRDKRYKIWLFDIIKHSKSNENYSVGAANAISALNAAKVNFSDMDLRGIRIPEANLSTALLDATNLSYADLQKVNFKGAWLRAVDFTQAHMRGVNFGEWPTLNFDGAIHDCCYSKKKHLLAVASQKTIYIYDAHSHQRIYVLRGHTDDVTNITFHPEGKKIASASTRDHTVRLWDVDSESELLKLVWYEGCSVQVMYDQEPADKVIVANIIYLYLVDDSIHYKAINLQGQIEKINIDHDIKPRRTEDAIRAILRDPSKKAQLNDSYMIELFHVFSTRGYLWCGSPHLHRKTLAFDPKGETLAFAWGDKTIILWDAQTGQELGRLEGEGKNSDVSCMMFDPHFGTLAFGTKDGAVNIFNINLPNQASKKFGGSSGMFINEVCSLCFGRDSTLIAFGKRGGSIEVWDVERVSMIRQFREHTDEVFSIVFSADGKLLASGGQDGTVFLWDTDTWKKLQKINLHTSAVTCLDFYEGKLVSGGWDHQLRFMNVEFHTTARELAEGRIGHTDSVYSVVFDSNNQVLASGSFDGSIRLWDIETGCELKTLEREVDDTISVFTKHEMCGLAFAKSSPILAAGTSEGGGRLGIWNTETGRKLYKFKHTVGSIYSTVFIDDAHSLASMSSDGTVSLWNLRSGREEKRLVSGNPNGGATGYCIAYQKGILAWDEGFGAKINLLNMRTNEPFFLEGHTGTVKCMAFDATGEYLASGSRDHTIRIWHIPTKKEVLVLNTKNEVLSLAWNHGGTHLVSGAENGVLSVWGIPSGKCREEIRAFNRKISIYSVAWGRNAQGEFLATGASDQSVRVWRVSELDDTMKVRLHWTSRMGIFIINDAKINGVIGLNFKETELLKQRGAHGIPVMMADDHVNKPMIALPSSRHYNPGLFGTSHVKPTKHSKKAGCNVM